MKSIALASSVGARQYRAKIQPRKFPDELIENKAYIKISRTATNLFFTFTYDDRILFSCTAGSVGMRKKERRRRGAWYEAGKKFGVFIMENKQVLMHSGVFNNIIVELYAAMRYFRIFMRACMEVIQEVLLEGYDKAVVAAKHINKKVRASVRNYIRLQKKRLRYKAAHILSSNYYKSARKGHASSQRTLPRHVSRPCCDSSINYIRYMSDMWSRQRIQRTASVVRTNVRSRKVGYRTKGLAKALYATTRRELSQARHDSSYCASHFTPWMTRLKLSVADNIEGVYYPITPPVIMRETCLGYARTNRQPRKRITLAHGSAYLVRYGSLQRYSVRTNIRAIARLFAPIAGVYDANVLSAVSTAVGGTADQRIHVSRRYDVAPRLNTMASIGRAISRVHKDLRDSVMKLTRVR